jgi:NADPH:quinone reductase-like Zn-dependent oxidoreductase
MEDGKMKRIDLTAYGTPQEIASCVEVPDVGAPGPGEVVFDVLAFPINPADISFCRGSYRLRPPLPATPGAECVGRVAAVGAGVTGVRRGDLVVNMRRENWVQRRRIRGGAASGATTRSRSRPASISHRQRCCASIRRRHSCCWKTTST